MNLGVFRHILLLALLIPAVTLFGAEDKGKSGIGPGKISLPNGPGSIEGLGSAFEPQLNSGTASYSVSIAMPPGVAGLQPDVTLRYNSGSGNSPFGLAWTYEPMNIRRQTSKGLPRYSGEDTFVMGGEELVPLSDGSYRQENESGFMRIVRSGEGWEVRDRKGTRYLLGTTSASRVRRPSGASFDETFAWYVDEVIDVNGNRMTYTYATYADSPGAIYIAAIRWSIFGNDCHAVRFDYEARPDAFSSYLSGFEVTTGRRCRRIRVLSRDLLVRRYELEYEVDDGIEPSLSYGLPLKFSLLRKVTQYDNRAEVEASYLPPLRLGYTQFDALKGSRGTLTGTPVWSLGNPNLALADINCDALPDLLYTDPLTGRHEVSYNLGRDRFGAPVPFVWQPTGVTLDQPSVQLLDIDGDGRVDLVQKAGLNYGHFVWFANTTAPVGHDESHPAWGAEQSFTTPHLPFDLDSPDVRSLDLNGDRRMDYMRTMSAGFVYYINGGDGSWHEKGIYLFGEEQMGDISYADDVQFCGSDGSQNRHVELADMNGDGLLDLVRWNLFGDSLEVVFWPNKGNGFWGYRTEMARSVRLGTLPEENLRLFDINGDGLSDVVIVGYDQLYFWINLGNKSFSSCFEIGGMPEYVAGQTVLRQADINGNGSTDFIWENWDAAAGGWKIEYYDFIGAVKPNLLTAIDNGLGIRTDIEYATTTDFYIKARDGGTPWNTRLPFASTVAAKITKNLGLDLDTLPGADTTIREMAYFDGYYDTFEREFRGFAFAKEVERGDDRYMKPNEQRTVHSPSVITRTAFHTGVSDGVDNNGDGRVDEKDAASGYEEEPLKGKPLWQETTLLTKDFDGLDNDGDGLVDEDDEGEPSGVTATDAVVFTRTVTDWRIRTLHGPDGGFIYRNAAGEEVAAYSIPYGTKDGRRVALAYPYEKRVWNFEANGRLSLDDVRMPRRAPVMTRAVTEVDPFGNTLWLRDYGEDTGSAYRDETFTSTDYAFNLDAWILGLPVLETVTDSEGHFAAATRNYYDGADYWGLGYGKVGTRGLLMRTEKAVNGAEDVPALSEATDRIGDPRRPKNTWITVLRNKYDEYGNIVSTADAEWRTGTAGHERMFGYDGVFHTYVTSESVVVDASRTFTATATYDYGGGVTLSTTDYNGHTSYAFYDSFYRPVSIVRPGDSTALPTQTFDYRLADPLRKLYYDYASDGRLTLVHTTDAYPAQRKGTHRREEALKHGTLDAYSFSDGAGRDLGTAEEDATPGLWIYKDIQRYSSRGHQRALFQPFRSSTLAFQIPPDSASHLDSYYDAMGRVTRTVNPPETDEPNALRSETRTYHLPFETIAYDAEDLRVGSSAYGTPTITKTDSRGLTLSVTETLRQSGSNVAVTVSTEYDVQKNVVRLMDAHGNAKIQRHDGLGRRFFVSDPDAGRTLTTFDGLGNPISVVDNKGQEIRYAYDGAGRILSEDWIGATTPRNATYIYDAPTADYPDASNLAGTLACVQDASGAEFLSYDARDRVTRRVKRVRYPTTGQLLDYSMQLSYDSMDRVRMQTLPDGDRITFAYDAHGKVCAMSNLVSGVTYTESDQLDTIRYANGVVTRYGYDPRLRLKRLTTSGAGGTLGTNIVDYAYTYDAMSNILSIDDCREGAFASIGTDRTTPTDTQLFTYDSLYRLTRFRISDAATHTMNIGTIDYGWDLIGNMTSKTTPGSGAIGHIGHIEKGKSVVAIGAMMSGGTAGTKNRTGRRAGDAPGPHALTSTGDGRAIDYDDNGNAVSFEGMALTWDYNNRLVAAENGDFRAEYAYDYAGRRVTKSVTGKTAAVTNSVTVYPDKTFELRDGNIPTKYAVGGVNRQARFTKMLNPSSVCRQWIALKEGWNFVSLQIDGRAVAPRPPTAYAIFALGTFVDSVSRFDSSTGKYVDVSPNDIIEPNVAYMIHAIESHICEVEGAYVGGNVLELSAGEQAVALGRAATLQQVLPQMDAKSVWTLDGTTAQGHANWNVWRNAPEGTRSVASASATLLSSAPSTTLKPETAAFVTLNSAATIDLDAAAPESIRFYHQNHLGSTVATTASDGSLVEETRYYPFGYPRATFGRHDATGDYTFIGKEQDAETQLHYVEARYLASHLGRFISVDPIGTDGGMNVYAYTSGNPVAGVDMTGLSENIEFQPYVPDGYCHMGGFYVAGGNTLLIGNLTYNYNIGDSLSCPRPNQDGYWKSFDSVKTADYERNEIDWNRWASCGFMVLEGGSAVGKAGAAVGVAGSSAGVGVPLAIASAFSAWHSADSAISYGYKCFTGRERYSLFVIGMKESVKMVSGKPEEEALNIAIATDLAITFAENGASSMAVSAVSSPLFKASSYASKIKVSGTLSKSLIDNQEALLFYGMGSDKYFKVMEDVRKANAVRVK